MLKQILKKSLSPSSRKAIRNAVNNKKRTFQINILTLKSFIFSDILIDLGRFYMTDKVEGHSYTKHYAFHFNRFRRKKINFLEIGVGGYQNPAVGGKSLRMWKRYFPFGNIFAIDIYDKSALQEDRIKIFKGSQVDKSFLKEVVEKIGDIDIIIDDGSHINEHVIETFKILFPRLKEGGIYAIEDTQTSYWKNYGGDSENLNNPNTLMNFFKSMADSLNNKEFINPGYIPSYYDKKVISLHFYHNLIFVYKGENDEESNLVKDNTTII